MKQAPGVFSLNFSFGSRGDFTIAVNKSWNPPYAQRIWEAAAAHFYDDSPVFRCDYIDSETAFMVQFGTNVSESGVALAWPPINEFTPAKVSNGKWKVSFALDAAECTGSNQKDDPCAPYYEQGCPHGIDYCAYGGTTEIFVNLNDNQRLDAHGFAPFGEVVAGFDNFLRVASFLGHTYGEVKGLCPPTPPATSPYCIYDAHGVLQGVDTDKLEPGDIESYRNSSVRRYAESKTAMWRRRIRSVTTL